MTARRTGLTRRNPAEFGTVEVRGERFRAFYRVKGKAFRAPKTFETRHAARAWLADQEKSLRGGTWIDPRLGAETVAGYCEDWMTSRRELLIEAALRRVANWASKVCHATGGPVDRFDCDVPRVLMRDENPLNEEDRRAAQQLHFDQELKRAVKDAERGRADLVEHLRSEREWEESNAS